jgi:DNA-binding transcriptional regulator YiaG
MSTKIVDPNPQISQPHATMSPEQVRAARSWLAWTQAELAAKAQVGLSTIKSYESGERVPIPNNLAAIRKALEDAGMTITADSVSGPIK